MTQFQFKHTSFYLISFIFCLIPKFSMANSDVLFSTEIKPSLTVSESSASPIITTENISSKQVQHIELKNTNIYNSKNLQNINNNQNTNLKNKKSEESLEKSILESYKKDITLLNQLYFFKNIDINFSTSYHNDILIKKGFEFIKKENNLSYYQYNKFFDINDIKVDSFMLVVNDNLFIEDILLLFKSDYAFGKIETSLDFSISKNSKLYESEGFIFKEWFIEHKYKQKNNKKIENLTKNITIILIKFDTHLKEGVIVFYSPQKQFKKMIESLQK